MSNLIIPPNFGPLPALLAGMDAASINKSALGGIGSSFASMHFKGKTWSVKYRGNSEDIVIDLQGTKVAAPFIQVIIVNASEAISKNYYEGQFQDTGTSNPPDCWSVNGVRPDPASPKKQKETCASCPNNQFGSAIKQNADGTPSKGKACRDFKRLVVVPDSDIANERFGGPMLLSVPPTSLKMFGDYVAKLTQIGAPYCAVSTRIKFDMAEAFPKLLFEPARMLTNEEFGQVLAMREDEMTKRILNDAVSNAEADPDADIAIAKAAAAPTPFDRLATQAAPVAPATTNVVPMTPAGPTPEEKAAALAAAEAAIAADNARKAQVAAEAKAIAEAKAKQEAAAAASATVAPPPAPTPNVILSTEESVPDLDDLLNGLLPG